MNTELNMNHPPINDEQNTTQHKQTLGDIFRTEREKQDLTLESVAKKLHLKESILVKIENNTITDISPTFIRGYVRSYAKLLTIDEMPLLKLIDDQKPSELAMPKPLQSFALEKTKRRRNRFFKIFSGLIVFTTIGVTGAWWLQDYQANQTPQSNSNPRGNTAQSEITLNTQTPAPVTTHSEANSSSIAPLANTPPLVPIEDPLTSSGVQNNDIPLILMPPVEETGLTGVDSETLTNAINESLARHESANTQSDESTASNTEGGLVLEFTADCWLEIRSSDNNLLFSGLKKQGDTLTFNEGAPFNLKIGAPSAVNITFNNQSIDMGRFIKSRSVAKFSIPLTE